MIIITGRNDDLDNYKVHSYGPRERLPYERDGSSSSHLGV